MECVPAPTVSEISQDAEASLGSRECLIEDLDKAAFDPGNFQTSTTLTVFRFHSSIRTASDTHREAEMVRLGTATDALPENTHATHDDVLARKVLRTLRLV